jgi:hypothetical protein
MSTVPLFEKSIFNSCWGVRMEKNREYDVKFGLTNGPAVDPNGRNVSGGTWSALPKLVVLAGGISETRSKAKPAAIKTVPARLMRTFQSFKG